MARPHSRSVHQWSGKLISCLLPPPPVRRELAIEASRQVALVNVEMQGRPRLGSGVAGRVKGPEEKARGRDWWGRQVLRGWEQLRKWWERRMCCWFSTARLGIEAWRKPRGG